MYEIQIHPRYQQEDDDRRFRAIIVPDKVSLFTWGRLSKKKILQQLQQNTDLFQPVNINQRYSARVFQTLDNNQQIRLSPGRFLHLKAIKTSTGIKIVESDTTKRSFKRRRRSRW